MNSCTRHSVQRALRSSLFVVLSSRLPVVVPRKSDSLPVPDVPGRTRKRRDIAGRRDLVERQSAVDATGSLWSLHAFPTSRVPVVVGRVPVIVRDIVPDIDRDIDHASGTAAGMLGSQGLEQVTSAAARIGGQEDTLDVEDRTSEEHRQLHPQ
jgi:hypothetical protein